MRSIYILSILVFTLLNFGCKTVSVLNETQKVTTQGKIIGAIGEQNGVILNRDYNPIAMLSCAEPVRLNATMVSFGKSTIKAFAKAKEVQTKNISINYIDSIAKKPKFLKLEIADRVVVVNELHSNDNSAVFEYLKQQKKAHIISGISVVFDKNQLANIAQAEEVLLERSGIKNYAIKTYTNGKLQQTIRFNQGIVFGYQTWYPCWQQYENGQLKIVDVTEKKSRCPKKIISSSKPKSKKVNYFKL